MQRAVAPQDARDCGKQRDTACAVALIPGDGVIHYRVQRAKRSQRRNRASKDRLAIHADACF